MGEWSCTLVTASGQVFTGNVEIMDENKEIQVYFATLGEGVKAYSPESPEVSAVINSSANIVGIAYDTSRKMLYWTGGVESTEIYRSGLHKHDGVEMLLSESQFGFLRKIGCDWITGNLYVVSSGGYILACEGRQNRKFNCTTMLSDQGDLRGIALHPNKGVMYWTRDGGAIMKSGMDGSDPAAIVPGLTRPGGITSDYRASRLYWTDRDTERIQSSNLDGDEVVTIAQLSSAPYGIAFAREKLFWSLLNLNSLQSSNKVGGDIRTVYSGTANICHLTVPDWFVPQNRAKPCGEQTCPNICVLAPISYTCLS